MPDQPVGGQQGKTSTPKVTALEKKKKSSEGLICFVAELCFFFFFFYQSFHSGSFILLVPSTNTGIVVSV